MTELISDFPELSGPEVNLSKEIYAHFGLLFFKFSLVEHSLINVLTFHHVGTALEAGEIASQQEWEAAHDFGFERARKMTLGHMVKSVADIGEFSTMRHRLFEAKKRRDYFAHHFFREEAASFLSNEGCWYILYHIKQLRDFLVSLDSDLDEPLKIMCGRLSINLPNDDQQKSEYTALIEESNFRFSSNFDKFDWSI
ncbi:hypothetical protein [Pannonibacter carbonis]|uniref:hypothetical protein n=1 Tax=Pannonibacter carbonis TaxID=2067569 RepID=UPI001300505F|nr:hypothetical protein [Pannonibacter carbonis]